MRNRLLLIIDPQIDFITGTLPVPDAVGAMDALGGYIRTKASDYARIVVTADRHPMRHCSFKTDGGEWPRHCVADSVGAAIWPAVMNELLAVSDKVYVFHKGEKPDKDEYSVFKNREVSQRILKILDDWDIGQIDVCGIAGDICVADTIRDGLRLLGDVRLNLLVRFSPSLDGGKALDKLISESGLLSTV